MGDQKSPDISSRCGPACSEVAPTFRRFVYRGNAVGASGRIVRMDPLCGLDHILPVQAASSLPVTGGLSESIMDRPYCFKVTSPKPRELFYVGYAHTRTEGYYDPEQRAWKTRSRASVRDVHLLGGRIAVEAFVAELSKTQGLHDDLPEITPSEDCHIRGLSLDGVPVRVKLTTDHFRKGATRAMLCSLVSSDAGLCRRIRVNEECCPSKGIEAYHMVDEITFPEGKPADVEVEARNCIHWVGVGRIYLAELLVSDLSRRLTMFRVKLGSSDGGEFSGGEVEDNGHTVP